MKKIQYFLGLTLLGLLLVYSTQMIYLFLIQDSLIFPRNTTPLNLKKTPLLNFKQLTVTTEDGERVIVWTSPPQVDKPILLFFHGNGDTLQSPTLVNRFSILAQQGFGIVALSYRGYGGSTGVPTENGVKRDAEAAYTFAFEKIGRKKHKIIAYGESLGTGIAVYLATQKPLAAVILQSPYTSLQALAKEHYPFLSQFFVKYSFASDKIIEGINAPLLILHGAEDKLIPVEQADILYNLALPPKRLVIFSQGAHGLVTPLPEVLNFLADLSQDSLPPKEKIRINAQ